MIKKVKLQKYLLMLAIENKDEEIKNPQTGIEDYSLVILTTIVVLAVVVYGFRKNKNKDYKSYSFDKRRKSYCGSNW